LEEGEKKSNLLDELYMLSKYPRVAQLFQLYRSKDEKWHQLVREIIFYDRLDLRYMYNRVMRLMRRFGQPLDSYFAVNSATGTYLLPDRLSDLNRLSELYEEFFYRIYPSVAKHLNFETYSQERTSNVLHGRVNWPETIVRSVRSGTGQTPIQFTASLPQHMFEIPENLLLVLSILRMKQDASRLRGYPFVEPLTPEETSTLGSIGEGCLRLLNNSMLQEMVPSASRLLLAQPPDTQVTTLESQVANRIRDESGRLAPYSRLLDWSKRYRQMNLRSLSPNRTNFPIDRRENLDTMFELWILFEFLEHLSNEHGAQISPESNPGRFHVSLDGFDFTLHYEKYYDGWALHATPDFTIEMNENPVVIMDAKNWQESKDEAIYKMLGYLDNLDAGLGILFFPNGTALPEERIKRPAGLRNHLRQCFVSSVVPPKESKEAVEAKFFAFEQVTALVREYLALSTDYQTTARPEPAK